MTTLLPIQHIRKILISEMALTNDQVLLYNQKFNIPADTNVYIYLSMVSSTVIGSNTVFENRSETVEDVTTEYLFEIASLNKLDTINIDVVSRGEQALLRKDDVVLALASSLSKQTQELYSFSISKNPIGFKDLSFLEESAILFRFNTSIHVTNFYKKEKKIDFYDSFTASVDATN